MSAGAAIFCDHRGCLNRWTARAAGHRAAAQAARAAGWAIGTTRGDFCPAHSP